MDSFDNRLFPELKKKVEEKMIEARRVNQELEDLINDLKSICPHNNIATEMIKSHHDNGYGHWYDCPMYICNDCGLCQVQCENWSGVLVRRMSK